MEGMSFAARDLPGNTYLPSGDPGPNGGGTYTATALQPSMQDYERIFGPAARDIKQDYQRNKRHQRYHLPDVLKGPNQYLTDRVDGLITDVNNSPFTTVILPYKYLENPDQKLKWNVYSFDEGMASRVPYESAARVLTQTKRQMAGYTVRQGLAIKMEHNFMMSPEGRQNFVNQLNQLVGSIQLTNDFDVHIALIQAPSYQKHMAEKYYTRDKNAWQLCRQYADLFGIMQKSENALDILIEEAKATLKSWGSPPPTFMLTNSKLCVQLTMNPEKTQYLTQGIDGVKRLRQGPDIASYRGLNIIHSRSFSTETGVPPRDLLRRRVRVAEYYRIPAMANMDKKRFQLYDEARDTWFTLDYEDLCKYAALDSEFNNKQDKIPDHQGTYYDFSLWAPNASKSEVAKMGPALITGGNETTILSWPKGMGSIPKEYRLTTVFGGGIFNEVDSTNNSPFKNFAYLKPQNFKSKISPMAFFDFVARTDRDSAVIKNGEFQANYVNFLTNAKYAKDEDKQAFLTALGDDNQYFMPFCPNRHLKEPVFYSQKGVYSEFVKEIISNYTFWTQAAMACTPLSDEVMKLLWKPVNISDEIVDQYFVPFLTQTIEKDEMSSEGISTFMRAKFGEECNPWKTLLMCLFMAEVHPVADARGKAMQACNIDLNEVKRNLTKFVYDTVAYLEEKSYKIATKQQKDNFQACMTCMNSTGQSNWPYIAFDDELSENVEMKLDTTLVQMEPVLEAIKKNRNICGSQVIVHLFKRVFQGGSRFEMNYTEANGLTAKVPAGVNANQNAMGLICRDLIHLDSNPNFQTSRTTKGKEFVIIRPNIEHYMLGIILGKGGLDDLGATLWGQTELSCYDDSMYGVWGMSYKYHERAIVHNEKNLVRIWDVAFDGYTGGMDDSAVDWSDEKHSNGSFNRATKNLTEPYDGPSMMVMAFDVDSNEKDWKKNWPSPIAFYDHKGMEGDKFCLDPENIFDVSGSALQQMRVFNNPMYRRSYDEYFRRMPPFNYMHQTRKDATSCAMENDTQCNIALAYQGSMRILHENGSVEEIKGSGHLGPSDYGVAAVRNGKGIRSVGTVPSLMRMI